MNFARSITVCLRKSFDYSGRASRSEFWWFMLFNLIVSLFTGEIGFTFSLVVAVLLLFPLSAVSFRRLHDIGRSGWWVLISLLPVIGTLVLLFWNVQPSQPVDNDWGRPAA